MASETISYTRKYIRVVCSSVASLIGIHKVYENIYFTYFYSLHLASQVNSPVVEVVGNSAFCGQS